MIKSVLYDACERLAASDSPRLDSEILLAHVLSCSRTYLSTYPEQQLTAEQQLQFKQLIDKRAHNVPVAYLLEEKEFWSRSFRVTPAVLVPRPDTECLIEHVLTAFSPDTPCRVLELGTGSGIISITLKLDCPTWHITATDRSMAALKLAKENALALGVNSIDWIAADWFRGIAPDKARFDLIISNPPYLADNDPHLPQLAAEPLLGLIAGADGLDAIRILIKKAPNFLKPGGTLILEHGYTQGAAVRTLFEQAGFSAITTIQDLAKLDRLTFGLCEKAHTCNPI